MFPPRVYNCYRRCQQTQTKILQKNCEKYGEKKKGTKKKKKKRIVEKIVRCAINFKKRKSNQKLTYILSERKKKKNKIKKLRVKTTTKNRFHQIV